MFWLLFSGIISIAVCPPILGACRLSPAYLRAVYAPVEGVWKVQLAWSNEHPTCLIILEEEAPGEFTFKVIDNQTCTSGRFCYFKTSTQSCDDGKPQYSVMKLTGMCSMCNFTTFAFTIGTLVNRYSATTACSGIIYPGTTSPRTASHLEYRKCGQNRTCFGEDINKGPGCYCEDGYVLDATTGLCVNQSVCPEINPKIPLNLNKTYKAPDPITLPSITLPSTTLPSITLPSNTLPSESIQPTSTDQTATLIVMAVLIAVFIGCIVLITAIFLCWRRRQKRLFGHIQESSLQQATTIAPRQSLSFLPQQADKWELARNDIQLESKIGSGNFGTVFKGMLSLTANSVTIKTFKDHMMVQGKSVQSVAIKVLKDTSSKECVETFLTEIDIMKRVSRGSNAHVVKMVGCITMSVPLALVLEFVSQGNLQDYLRSAGKAQCKDSVKCKDNDGNPDEIDQIDSVDKCSITEQDADQDAHLDMDVNQHHDSNHDSDEVQKAEDDLDQENNPDCDQRTEEDGACDVAESDLLSFAYQLSHGMQYLSSLGVLHRDLACRNILVDESKVLKIADFGLARNTEEYVSSMKDKLPLRWMSPETFNTGTFSEKSDVWSYGVCLWEIFSMGSLPFEGLQNAAIVPQILAGYRLQKPKKCNDHIYSIMTQCWNDKPEERPSFTTLHSKFEDLVSSGVALEYLHLDSGQEDHNL